MQKGIEAAKSRLKASLSCAIKDLKDAPNPISGINFMQNFFNLNLISRKKVLEYFKFIFDSFKTLKLAIIIFRRLIRLKNTFKKV